MGWPPAVNIQNDHGMAKPYRGTAPWVWLFTVPDQAEAMVRKYAEGAMGAAPGPRARTG